ncbi:MAG: hypothetical protein IPM66_19550 [Acidobacteriota bacterium]|nr:MAG: hypothetical protein IPM66_19550 [Acidobacteriota bacterium]
MPKRKRYPSLIIIFLFVLAAGAWFGAGALVQDPAGRTQEREALAKKAAPSGTLADRLDKDDGYGIVLFFSSTVHGNLEVCGCPIHPLGGVARRAGYVDAFRRRSPDAAVLQVDAGYIFSDEKKADSSGLKEDALLMNDWIVRANEAMNLDLVNLSWLDLPYAGRLLGPDAQLKPEKSTLISSNIKAADGSRVSPAPWVIKVVTGRRLTRPVRIAFIGVSDRAPEDRAGEVARSGFVIEDPLASVKAALAEVHDKADVTVVVGFLSLPMVNRLARQNDDLDIIINSEERGLVPDPRQINNALVVYAAKETKYLGELRFYTDAGGVVDRFTVRYVELDEIIPDHPRMAEMTRQARSEIDALQTRLAEEEARAWLAANPDGTRNSPYVLSETCAKCHVSEYETWRKSLHAVAFAALETKRRVYDAACVGCHSLGFRKEGFINIKATPQFANVQCESCHGPGAAHVADPKAGNYRTPSKNESCLICHDRENSPDFDFDRYWPVIAHINSLKESNPGRD